MRRDAERGNTVIASEESHVFKAKCDVCGTAAPDARTKSQAAANAVHTGWKFPTWWTGTRYTKRDLCPTCAPTYLNDLASEGITYSL